MIVNGREAFSFEEDDNLQDNTIYKYSISCSNPPCINFFSSISLPTILNKPGVKVWSAAICSVRRAARRGLFMIQTT